MVEGSGGRLGRGSRALFQGFPVAGSRPLRRHREQLFLSLSLAAGQGVPRLAGAWWLRGRHGYHRASEIETFFALDAFRGKAGEARFLYRDDIAIPLDA